MEPVRNNTKMPCCDQTSEKSNTGPYCLTIKNILQEIFSYMDPKDLVSCSQVNRTWNECAQKDSQWIPLLKKYFPSVSLEKGENKAQFRKCMNFILNLKNGLYYHRIINAGETGIASVGPDNNIIMENGGKITVLDLENNSEIELIPAIEEKVKSVRKSKDGNKVITLSTTNKLKVWDLKSNCVITNMDDVSDFQVIKGNKFVTTNKGKFDVWDLNTGHEIVSFPTAHHGDIDQFFEMSNGKIITTSTDNTLKIWDLDQHICTNSVQAISKTPIFETKKKLIVFESDSPNQHDEYEILFFDPQSNQIIKKVPNYDNIECFIEINEEEILIKNRHYYPTPILNLETMEMSSYQIKFSHRGLAPVCKLIDGSILWAECGGAIFAWKKGKEDEGQIYGHCVNEDIKDRTDNYYITKNGKLITISNSKDVHIFDFAISKKEVLKNLASNIENNFSDNKYFKLFNKLSKNDQNQIYEHHYSIIKPSLDTDFKGFSTFAFHNTFGKTSPIDQKVKAVENYAKTFSDEISPTINKQIIQEFPVLNPKEAYVDLKAKTIISALDYLSLLNFTDQKAYSDRLQIPFYNLKELGIVTFTDLEKLGINPNVMFEIQDLQAVVKNESPQIDFDNQNSTYKAVDTLKDQVQQGLSCLKTICTLMDKISPFCNGLQSFTQWIENADNINSQLIRIEKELLAALSSPKDLKKVNHVQLNKAKETFCSLLLDLEEIEKESQIIHLEAYLKQYGIKQAWKALKKSKNNPDLSLSQIKEKTIEGYYQMGL